MEWNGMEFIEVLEPSIRGFLSILEKQFPRNDLYLFELLQNAVDDGAAAVKLKQTAHGIVFLHDGRGFTPMVRIDSQDVRQSGSLSSRLLFDCTLFYSTILYWPSLICSNSALPCLVLFFPPLSCPVGRSRSCKCRAINEDC